MHFLESLDEVSVECKALGVTELSLSLADNCFHYIIDQIDPLLSRFKFQLILHALLLAVSTFTQNLVALVAPVTDALHFCLYFGDLKLRELLELLQAVARNQAELLVFKLIMVLFLIDGHFPLPSFALQQIYL